jgi:hypothetical protein
MRRRAWAGLVAGALAGATDVSYIIIIRRQGESSAVVPWVFLAIAVVGIAAVIGWMSSPGRLATVIFAVTTPLLFVLGVLGIFSIGLPLLVASMFCLGGVFQSRSPTPSVGGWTAAVVAGFSAVAVILAAVALIAIAGGGQRITVSCRGRAPGPGMPRVVSPGPHAREAPRPHPCRTVTSP